VLLRCASYESRGPQGEVGGTVAADAYVDERRGHRICRCGCRRAGLLWWEYQDGKGPEVVITNDTHE
jgi:hypothetical protein